ncbi:MAG: hypothetical protein K8I82_25140, partial [Anaerolineae bacterium]|nr:hypothetical protein [Anaerolineae bacterium]
MFKMLFKYRLLWVFVVPLLGLIATPTNTLVVAQSPVFILNIGDSRMDEYYPPAEDAPSRDGCPASLPGCLSYGWVEQLMYLRGTYLSYGQYGAWDFPRRHGYAYNLALSGVAYEGQSDIANTNFYGALNTIFAQQPTFDIIFVGLGANDFATYRADGYQEVANGSVTPQQKIDKILASFNTLMAAVRAKAPTTPVRVHLITPNLIDSIAAGLGYTPAQRNLV